MLFIVQVAHVRGTAQTVPSPSHLESMPETHPDELVSCPLCVLPWSLSLGSPGSFPWMCPECLSAHSSFNSLAPFLPTSGRQDVDSPSNSGSSAHHCLPVCAVSRQQAELEVPKLWRAWWLLVHGRVCPWGVHGQRAPSG